MPLRLGHRAHPFLYQAPGEGPGDQWCPLSNWSHTARVTSAVVAVPPRSGVCSDGSAVTRSIAFIRRAAAACLAQMLQHHHRGPERADRIGDALAGDVEGRAVDRLEHRRVAPLRIEIGGRRDAERAGERRGEIGQDVGVQVGRDDRVERLPAAVTMRMVMASTSILSQVTSGNSRATSAAISSHITMPWRCAFDLVTTVSSLRGRERASSKAKRMMRSTPARVNIDDVGRDLLAAALMHPPADAGIFALRVLAHDHPVEFRRPSRSQRRVDAGQDARRAHIGVLVEAAGRSRAAGPTA